MDNSVDKKLALKEGEKLSMVYESDVNSFGLWLHKKGYLKGQYGLTIYWVISSILSICFQIFFAGQLVYKYFYQFNQDPVALFGYEEKVK